jgi:hypothetical protein
MKEKIIISHIKGGFGNQLHQYGTGLAAALKLNARFKVDLSFFDREQYKNWYKLDKINVEINKATDEEIAILKNRPTSSLFFRATNKLGLPSQYNKKSDLLDLYGFKPDLRILNIDHSAYISGWCPKEAYVRNIREVLIDNFRPNAIFSQEAANVLEQIKSTNSISVHIRRGDYLELEHFFRVVPLEFYRQAVRQILLKVNSPTFFIFSNDLEWVKDNVNFIDNAVFVDFSTSKEYNGFADLEEYELMKQCKHNIIGNSSFSWWAAYLNENIGKIVYTPKTWFNDKFYQRSLEENPIFPSDWCLINE